MINSSTTDLDTGEARPSEEHDNFPHAAKDAISLITLAATSYKAVEVHLSVKHNETPVVAIAVTLFLLMIHRYRLWSDPNTAPV